MTTAATKGAEYIEHYGVKGMRWGKRKDKTPTEAQVKESLSRKGKTKLTGEGGEKQPAAEDAVKAAMTRQKLKKSGPAALSNGELKELSERLQLEVNVARLDKEASTGPGKKFATQLVKEAGTNRARQEVAAKTRKK